jgi:hypothetical protein
MPQIAQGIGHARMSVHQFSPAMPAAQSHPTQVAMYAVLLTHGSASLAAVFHLDFLLLFFSERLRSSSQ